MSNQYLAASGEPLLSRDAPGPDIKAAAPSEYSPNDLAGMMGDALGEHVSTQTPAFDDWANGVQLPAGPLRDGLRTMNEAYDRYGFRGGNSLVLTTMLQRDPRNVRDFVTELTSA